MTCGHYRTSNKKWPDGYEGWRCKACGANLEMTPKPFDEVVEGILTNPTHVVETGVPDLGKHALRETWRTGTAAQEERTAAHSGNEQSRQQGRHDFHRPTMIPASVSVRLRR